MIKIPFSVTGHRPEKLYNAYPKQQGYYILIEFCEYILKTYIDQIREIGTGMAIGFDMAIAQASINLNIPFVACIPFPGQEKLWPVKTKNYYKELVSKAFQVIYVCPPEYAAYKMQVRNEFMVDNSEKQIALWNGSNGGTYNCVKYVKSKKVETVNVWNIYLDFLKYKGIKF